jgi:hypothetical protein
MNKLNNTLRRSFIGSLVFLQIFFFPCYTYAETGTTDPSSSPTQTTTNTSEAPASSDVPAAATDSGSASAPETTTKRDTDSPDDRGAAAGRAADAQRAKERKEAKAKAAAEAAAAAQAAQTNNTNATNNATSGVANDVTSNATSGNASVNDNVTGGNAASGNAFVSADLINILQSQTNLLGGNSVSFNADLYGDVVGDMFLDPSSLASVQNNILNSATVQVKNNGSITNNVDLSALSGNATVHDNGTGGNATSGDANAVANIFNLISSVITTGGSFFGNINIYGNFQGDILLPPEVLNRVLATNSIPTTTLTVTTDTNLNANLDNNNTINNNLSTSAVSGDAKVHDNVGGGNATTGKATTNITVLNLTKHQIVGANTLLVFVNVLGKWVGVIMDAPAGSTAAALGGGITQDSTLDQQANLDLANNNTIQNNVNVGAQSGNASVHDNRSGGGNATTGNATASANIANVSNSNFSLSGWFGILFINVFGTWNGSFGVDTAMGNPIIAPPVNNGPAPSASASQAFRFVPSSNGSASASSFQLAPESLDNAQVAATYGASGSNSAAQTGNDSGTNTAVLGTSDDNGGNGASPSSYKAADSNGFWWPSLIGVGVGVSLLAGERIVSTTQRRRLNAVR